MTSPVVMEIVEQVNDLPDNLQQRVLEFILQLRREGFQKSEDAWEVLDSLTGTVEAPCDWSAEHDHYLYGVPKQQPIDS